MYEETALSSINSAAVKTYLNEDIVFEMELGYSPVSGGAKAMASYWKGNLSVQVEYRDPPVGTRQTKIKVSVGDFDGKEVVAHQESKDNLKDVRDSYPEAWAAFCARLPDVFLAAEVVRS